MTMNPRMLLSLADIDIWLQMISLGSGAGSVTTFEWWG